MTEVTKIEQGTAIASQPDPMVTMIERMVLNPAADLEKLERMLVMKERMDAQRAKVAFAEAIAAARAEIPPIIKDATVDFTTSKGRTNYKHETLAGISKTIDPILSRNGLSYRFRTDQAGGAVTVTCIISHREGYSEETSLSGAPDQSGNKNGFQAVGSAVTYLQRYTLKAALGLSAEVDDDAQSAEPRFDPEAAHQRIMSRISRAETLDELREIWGQEAETVKRIGRENRQLGVALYDAREAGKARLSTPITGEIIDDEIPY